MNNKKVCFFSAFKYGKNFGGFSVRYLGLSSVLKKAGFEVQLFSENISFFKSRSSSQPFSKKLESLINKFDVFVIQPDIFYYYYEALKKKILVVDLICPFHVEHQEKLKNLKNNQTLQNEEFFLLNEMFNQSISKGDYFLCGNENQKKYYQKTFNTFNRPLELLKIVPFGIFSQKPKHSKKVLKTVYKTISKNDVLFIWLGGLWDWYDPFALIQAFQKLIKNYPFAKLVFLSGKSDSMPYHEMYQKTLSYAKETGLLNQHIFIMEKAIPYSERADYLMEADVAVTSFPLSLETKLSCRIRNTDFIWCELPMISSKGDSFSAKIQKNKWGLQVKNQSVPEWEKALEKMMNDKIREGFRKKIHEDKNQFQLKNLTEPLIEILKNPERNKNQNSFEHLNRKFLKGKKVCIFGASKAGLRTLMLAKRYGFKVECFVDNDETKWGKYFENQRIVSKETLLSLKPDLIIIASFPGRNAISAQLIEMGYLKNKNFIWFGKL